MRWGIDCQRRGPARTFARCRDRTVSPLAHVRSERGRVIS
jgi:hypothetical protein